MVKIITKSDFENDFNSGREFADGYADYTGFELTNFNPSTELAGLDCDVILWRNYRKCARFFIKDETAIMAVKLCLSNITQYQRWFCGHKDKQYYIICGNYEGALGCGEIIELPNRKLRLPKYDKAFVAPNRSSTQKSYFVRKKVKIYFGYWRTVYEEYDFDDNLIATWGGISVSNSDWSYL